MNRTAVAAGTEKTVTPAQIIATELEKIEIDKKRMKEESLAYMSRHPEISSLMDELLGEILYHKPTDVVKFAGQFFNSKRDPGAAGLVPIVIAGPSGEF